MASRLAQRKERLLPSAMRQWSTKFDYLLVHEQLLEVGVLVGTHCKWKTLKRDLWPCASPSVKKGSSRLH